MRCQVERKDTQPQARRPLNAKVFRVPHALGQVRIDGTPSQRSSEEDS